MRPSLPQTAAPGPGSVPGRAAGCTGVSCRAGRLPDLRSGRHGHARRLVRRGRSTVQARESRSYHRPVRSVGICAERSAAATWVPGRVTIRSARSASHGPRRQRAAACPSRAGGGSASARWPRSAARHPPQQGGRRPAPRRHGPGARPGRRGRACPAPGRRVTGSASAAARPGIWPGGLQRAPAASAGCAALRAP